MARHNRKPKRTRPAAQIDDDTLIRHCIVYAQSIAAYRAGFDADPDSDSAFAFALGAAYRARATELLAELSVSPASRPIELSAKARLVPLVLASLHDSITAEAQAFMLSFAEDVLSLIEARPDLAADD